MYRNIDSPLQWMKTVYNILNYNILKVDGMNLKQSATDPCIFYTRKKVVPSLILYVDDTLRAGERKEVK
jgi:hypothetical protein